MPEVRKIARAGRSARSGRGVGRAVGELGLPATGGPVFATLAGAHDNAPTLRVVFTERLRGVRTPPARAKPMARHGWHRDPPREG